MSYIATTDAERQEMLKICGVSSVADLFADIPSDVAPKSFNLPEGKSELDLHCHFRELAGRNKPLTLNFFGGGFYDHFVPAAVDALVSRSEFYTAYTPYQPELSQGTLQAIYEYQTAICRLTNMDVANASLYDGGTALYEACQMAIHATRRNRIVIDGGLNPVYRKMLYSYTANLHINLADCVPVIHGHCDRSYIMDTLDESTAAVVLQNPNFFGVVDDHTDIVEYCHKHGILVIQVIYPIAAALLKTPGEMGVDIAVGEGQSLGLPLSFGGPYLGIMATTKKQVRRMPGRIAGRTVDKKGREAFVLTLQAREQHIRREKATSNICTNEALCALRAQIYLSLLGKNGLKEVAQLCAAKAEYAKQQLNKIKDVEVMRASPTFNEFTVKLPRSAKEVVNAMLAKNVAPGLPLGRFYDDMDEYMLVAVTEKRTKAQIDQLAEALESELCQ